MTVLLVDDAELFLEREKTFLESVGFTVKTARSGEEALATMEEAPPAIVLADLYLPGIGGDELCRRLRADRRWRDVPLVMVTAASGDEEIRRCLDAGCDDYLTKPVRKKELMEKIRRLLGRVRGRTAERAPVSVPVRVKAGEADLGATAQDISTNGVFVRSRTVLPVGTAVELDLELPGGRRLPALGKVRRVKEGAGGGMGIYFIHLEPQGRRDLAELIKEKKGAPPPPPGASPSDDPRGRELEEENRRLHARILELEGENRDFAEQIVRTEEVNNTLTSLYVASSRLHSVLGRQQVADIIKEVVISFIGAEKFAVLTFDRQAEGLRFEAGEGFEGEDFPEVAAGEGVWRRVVEEGERWFREEGVGAGSDDPGDPIAVIPLRVHGRPMGVIAVYRLFVQKDSFTPADLQLFSMLAEHAATALFSSMLYQESERKRETYRGFMDLLLK